MINSSVAHVVNAVIKNITAHSLNMRRRRILFFFQMYVIMVKENEKDLYCLWPLELMYSLLKQNW